MQAGAVVQDEHPVTLEPRLDLANTIDVHERRSMHAQELRCRESLLQMRERAAMRVHGLTRVNANEIVIGLDPVDLARRE